jgi:nucleotide-binding universal stress UspA family protein
MAIAQQYGGKVYGAHVINSQDYLFTAPEAWPAFEQQEEQLQRDSKARLDEQLRGVPHQELFGVGDVWTVLSRFIGEHSVDLLVVGTHGRTGARKLLLGSIAEQIFRQASCPVLSVGPNVTCKSDGRIKFERILFATNFGKESLAALPFALSLAEENQSELALLHVVEKPAIPDFTEVKLSVIRRMQQLVLPEAAAWCKVEYLVEFGNQFAPPAEPIVAIAEERGADLLVLGARTTSGALGTVTHLTNTTAQYVVAHATCPVLTVRG